MRFYITETMSTLTAWTNAQGRHQQIRVGRKVQEGSGMVKILPDFNAISCTVLKVHKMSVFPHEK